MKTGILILIANALTVSAFASPVITVSKLINNGKVPAPQFQQTSCTISSGIVKLLATGGAIQFPRPLLKQAKFSKAIPNVTVMESLAADAARAPVVTHPGPVGGALLSDNVFIDGLNTSLYTTVARVVITQNNSVAAAKLEKFLDQNCK